MEQLKKELAAWKKQNKLELKLRKREKRLINQDGEPDDEESSEQEY